MPLYGYCCVNDKCSNFFQTIDRMCAIDNRDDQYCETCTEQLVREEFPAHQAVIENARPMIGIFYKDGTRVPIKRRWK